MRGDPMLRAWTKAADPFRWIPASMIALAVEAETDIGVPAVRLEGRADELVVSLANGSSLRLLLGDTAAEASA